MGYHTRSTTTKDTKGSISQTGSTYSTNSVDGMGDKNERPHLLQQWKIFSMGKSPFQNSPSLQYCGRSRFAKKRHWIMLGCNFTRTLGVIRKREAHQEEGKWPQTGLAIPPAMINVWSIWKGFSKRPEVARLMSGMLSRTKCWMRQIFATEMMFFHFPAPASGHPRSQSIFNWSRSSR